MAAKRWTICVMDLERRLWFTAGLHFKIRYLIIYIQNHHCNLIIHKLNYGIYINLIMMLVINVILYPLPLRIWLEPWITKENYLNTVQNITHFRKINAFHVCLFSHWKREFDSIVLFRVIRFVVYPFVTRK